MVEILKISEHFQSEYDTYYALMAEEKRRRVDRFRFAADKKRTVYGEMLARKMLARHCGVDAATIVFDVAENGKPYAKNVSAHFNISHSGDCVLCAVSDRPVGVDIEEMRTVEPSLVRYVCTAKELRYVQAAPTQQEQMQRFFKIWTAKEAYLKCAGTGIVDCKSVCVLQEEIQKQLHSFYQGNYAVSIYQI